MNFVFVLYLDISKRISYAIHFKGSSYEMKAGLVMVVLLSLVIILETNPTN